MLSEIADAAKRDWRTLEKLGYRCLARGAADRCPGAAWARDTARLSPRPTALCAGLPRPARGRRGAARSRPPGASEVDRERVGRGALEGRRAGGAGLRRARTSIGDPNAEAFYRHMGARRVGEVRADVEGTARTLPLLRLELAG